MLEIVAGVAISIHISSFECIAVTSRLLQGLKDEQQPWLHQFWQFTHIQLAQCPECIGEYHLFQVIAVSHFPGDCSLSFHKA
jgi:hypothetical protein